ncbi:MAG: hypothetical protein P8H03_00120 [Emcibacteraceae bacterium]|nr:hypothetical protein [Emcibacteraceae bacterium]MDG1996533.1 hypothetical protein [Emcibacteraceae bacterium]
MTISTYKETCQVCGAKNDVINHIIECRFCRFKKDLSLKGDPINKDLLFAEDINIYFKNKYVEMQRGETFKLTLPVSRFYKEPTPEEGQVNFFKSKNIMFLLEQNGFHMVTRKSRFSTTLDLIVRKV